MKSVSIGIYNTQAEAEAAQEILAQNGIRAAIIGHERGVPSAIMGGLPVVELLVSDDDEERAKSLLGTFPVLDDWITRIEFSELVTDELERGAYDEAIIQLLVERGWPEVTAGEYVRAKRAKMDAQIRPAPEDSGRLDPYRSRVIRGLIALTAGVLLTVYTLQSNGGFFSFVWWGLIGFGAFELISGIKGWYDHR